MVLNAAPSSPTRHIGLLAASVTDTISPGEGPGEAFNLNSYLPMLYTLIPAEPSSNA
jgi:hypothetical protein